MHPAVAAVSERIVSLSVFERRAEPNNALVHM